MVNGLTQYKLNAAKSYAQNVLEAVHKIEMMAQLAEADKVGKAFAETYIAINVANMSEHFAEIQTYLAPKEGDSE